MPLFDTVSAVNVEKKTTLICEGTHEIIENSDDLGYLNTHT